MIDLYSAAEGWQIFRLHERTTVASTPAVTVDTDSYFQYVLLPLYPVWKAEQLLSNPSDAVCEARTGAQGG